MSNVAPKPVINKVVATYKLPMNTELSLVEDIDSRLWIRESCPVGVHYWTLEQSATISLEGQKGDAFRAALRAAKRHMRLARIPRPIQKDRSVTRYDTRVPQNEGRSNTRSLVLSGEALSRR